MEGNLQAIAQEYDSAIEEFYGKRFYVYRRIDGTYPAIEEFYVLAPQLAKAKCRNPKAFNQQWELLTHSLEAVQLSLF